jgi:PKD repeat protein
MGQFRKLFVISAVVASFSIFGLISSRVVAALPQDCSTGSIITCGVQNQADLQKDVTANKPSDIQALYSSFGLNKSDYANITKAELGTAYKSNGTIVVNGQTVATNVWMVGRQSESFTTPKVFNGKTYYASDIENSFAAASYPVVAMFNSAGVLQFAVVTSCGNPMNGTKVTPSYSCDDLQKTAVSGSANTYSFTTNAAAAHNAAISKVVYNFGDGDSVSEASPTTPVQHTYTKSGSYTAQVTVYVTLPGNQTITTTSAHCQTLITVVRPYQSCLELTGALVDTSTRKYTFTATTRQGNGANLKSASFNFGDGTAAPNVGPTTATTVTISHSYSGPGTYNVTATTQFSSGSTLVSTNCSVSITIAKTPQPPTPTPSPTPAPCVYNQSLPATSSNCQPPKPNPSYSCTSLTISQGSADTVTVTGFNTNATNGAVFSNATIDWGNGSSLLTTNDPVNQTYHYVADGTYTITATANFTVNGQTVSVTSNGCTQQVSFATQTKLVDTGSSHTLSVFLATTALGAIAYRLFFARRVVRRD